MPTPLSPPAEPGRELELLDDPERARILLDPLRRRLVHELAAPDTAAGLARRLGLPRQRLHHHLVALERAGLVEEVEVRRKGNCLERLLRARARTFLVDPAGLGELAPPREPAEGSSAGTAQVLAGALADHGALRRAAAATGKRVADHALCRDVRFARAGDREAFLEELERLLDRLAARYDAPAAPGARGFRLTLAVQPALPRT